MTRLGGHEVEKVQNEDHKDPAKGSFVQQREFEKGARDQR